MQLYHIFNRGVDKRKVFIDKQDHYRFIHDLYEFNDQKNASNLHYYFSKTQKLSTSDVDSLKKKKRNLLIKLHAFCMLPNHYHLLISPLVENGISLFMKKLNMGYARYFNERYERSGALWQGKYKSVYINTDAHFLYIPYYIHLNPLDLKFPEWRDGKLHSMKEAETFLHKYRWSSHLDYLSEQNFPSLTQRELLSDIIGVGQKYKENLKKILGDFNVETISDMTLE